MLIRTIKSMNIRSFNKAQSVRNTSNGVNKRDLRMRTSHRNNVGFNRKEPMLEKNDFNEENLGKDQTIYLSGMKQINPQSVIFDVRKTSSQDPYQIIDVAHIVSDNNTKGRLTISISPGKKDTKWNRDLQMDLDEIKNNGIQVIVCLLEWSEMKALDITEYPKKAQDRGLLFYHLPIRDRFIPQDKEVDALIPIVAQHLIAGQNILVHCRGGLGRAGTICACCLCYFGYDGNTAIDTVRKQRPGAVQNKKQVGCVLQYQHGLTGG